MIIVLIFSKQLSLHTVIPIQELLKETKRSISIRHLLKWKTEKRTCLHF